MNFANATVYVVDDDDALRHSLEELIESFELHCQSYATATEFLAAFNPEGPSCLLLDLRMPQVSGLSVQQHLCELRASVPIVFLSAYGDTASVARAMKNGAVDFLQKPFRAQDLWDAIELSLRRDAQRRKALREQDATRKQLASLTPNERIVLEMLMAGMPNRAMADQLDVSLRTVELRRAALFRKMECVHLAELFAKIFRISTHASGPDMPHFVRVRADNAAASACSHPLSE